LAIRVIVHVLNEDAVLADVEKLPDPQDNCIVAYNPRKRDGKPLPLLADGVTTVIYPWTRVTYVEILDEANGMPSADKVVGFFREGGGHNG
jgi:hypothetical protein